MFHIHKHSDNPKARIDRTQKIAAKHKAIKIIELKNTHSMKTQTGGFKSMSYDKERLSIKDCGWGL